MKTIKLLYLPYAGGSALLCKSWKRYLGTNVEIQPIELAGRGSRFKEPFYTDMEEAIEDIFHRVLIHTNQPYALYGHSLGALLSFELYYKIRDSGIRQPEYMFFSGSKPPFGILTGKELHKLADREFIEEIVKYNGMEKAILENEELLDLFLPIIRADFKLLEQYLYKKKPMKIEKGVSVLYGNDMTFDLVKGWSDLTDGEIEYHHIDGNHFFIKEKAQEVLFTVTDKLNQLDQVSNGSSSTSKL